MSAKPNAPQPIMTPAPVEWKVDSQFETMAPGPGGNLVRGVQINWSTGTGLSGSVFQPLNAYNMAAIIAAIEARVREMSQVHGLRGVVHIQ